MPTLRAIPNPVMRDAYLQTIHRVSGVEERTVLEVLHRQPARRSADQGRITADAVIGAADALPVDRILRGDHAGRGGAPAADPARAGPAAPRRRTRSGRTSCRRRSPASSSGRSSSHARRTTRAIHPPFSMSALMAGLDDEIRGLAQAILARPSPDLARDRRGPDHLRGRPLPAPSRAAPPRRARRLGRRRDPRRRGPAASATT